MKQKNFWKKVGVALSGLIFCGIGVGVFLFAGLGVDPASVLMQGLGKTFHFSYGTASAILNIIILSLVFFIDRKYINISSILAVFGIGYTADLMNKLLLFLLKNEITLAMKFFLIMIGLIIMGIGVATYIQADLGVGAIDLISEIISDKMKIQYRVVRICSDAILLISGYFLGGIIGIGTIAAVFLTGPIVQFVRPTVVKVVNKII